jgi:hypothetical protein
MLDWRKEGSALVRRMEDAFGAQRPIPLYQKAILALLILGLIVAVVLMVVRQ